MVLAVLVLGLPKPQQQKALRYGILGAFAFRILAILLAVYLIQIQIVMLIGAAYLLWLPYQHFGGSEDAATRRTPKPAMSWMGMNPFWSTVAKVELTDIVFAIDSILVAVAMSKKLWVVITGGLLGILTMRLLIGTLLGIVRRYPKIVDGAYVIVAWVGIKLMIEYAHAMHWIGWELPKWLAISIMLVLFAGSAAYAKRYEAPPEPAGPGAGDSPPDLTDPAEILKS